MIITHIMEYNLRPQWRQWSHVSCQHPTCGRCGLSHVLNDCFAIQRQCFKCHKYGHYGRMCRSQHTLPKISTANKDQRIKSKGKKVRDTKRLAAYLERKSIMTELPFSSLRPGQFREIALNNNVLTDQLKSTSNKFSAINTEQSTRINVLEEKLKKTIEEVEMFKTREQELQQRLSGEKESNTKLQQSLECALISEKELKSKVAESESAKYSILTTLQMVQIQDLQNQLASKSCLISEITEDFLQMRKDYEVKLNIERENVKKEQRLRENSEQTMMQQLKSLLEEQHRNNVQAYECQDQANQCYQADQPNPFYQNPRNQRHYRGRGRFY